MPSPRPTLLLWTATLAIPVVFFLLLEGGLRLFGYGPDTALFIRDDWKGTAYYRINPDVARRYFSDDDHTTYVSRDRFQVRKPAGTYRIFCLGASTTIGFPYMFNGAYSKLVADRLEVIFPDQPVEVINVGITAINSFAVLDLARELVDYQPDLFIVYMGHNEFYGPFGPGSHYWGGMRPWMAHALMTLRKWKTMRLAEDFIGLFGTAGDRTAPEGNLMERIVADRAIPLDGPAYEQSLKAFEQNYRALIGLTARHGVDLVISTLAANLRDQVPFVSIEPEDLSSDRRAEWHRSLEEAFRLSRAGDCEDALPAFTRAAALFDGYAEAAYLQARCLDEMGDSLGASGAYARARDLDGLKFRAPGGFNDAIRQIARETETPLADTERAFAVASPAGVPGENLFWEHVHPRLTGYTLMAETLIHAMEKSGFVRPAMEWAQRRRILGVPLPVQPAVTPLDHEVARLRIEILTNRWPFRTEPVPVEFAPATPMEEAAWDYVRNRIGWAEAHKRLGDLYATELRHVEAAAEYLALASMTPYDSFFYETAGDMLGRARQFSNAVGPFRRALRIEPSPVVSAKLAIALYESGNLNEAIDSFQIALATEGVSGPPLSAGQRLQAVFLLGLASVRAGDRETAIQQLRRLHELDPSAPQIPRLGAAIDLRFGATPEQSD